MANNYGKNLRRKKDFFFICKDGDLKSLKFLMDVTKEIDIDYINENNALFLASEYNHLNLVKYLVGKKGIFLDVVCREKDNKTPLHIACEKGYKDIVNCLTSAGANVNVKDDHSLTPLFKTVIKRHSESVEILRSLFVTFKADFNILDKRSRTPLFWLIENYDPREHDEFENSHAREWNERKRTTWEMISLFIKLSHNQTYNINLNATNDVGDTPLIAVLKNKSHRGGKHGLIKLLIDSDADLHVVDADQQNALDLARKLDWDQTIIELLESKHYSQSNHKTM